MYGLCSVRLAYFRRSLKAVQNATTEVRGLAEWNCRVNSMMQSDVKSGTTRHSAAYITSPTRDQKRFTISELVADWRELMIPRPVTRSSIVHASEQLDPRCSQRTYHRPNQWLVVCHFVLREVCWLWWRRAGVGLVSAADCPPGTELDPRQRRRRRRD